MQNSTIEKTKYPFLAAALAAEPIFEVAGFTVTNAMINAYASVAFFVIVALIARRRRTLIPKGVHNIIEAVIEFVLNEIEKVTEDAKKARAFLPLIGTIFFFVLVNNWMGLLPGTGSIGWEAVSHGEAHLIPLMRPATSDLNMTLAIAVVAIFATHLAGLKSLGFVNHFSKFFNFRGIFQAVRKGPMAIGVACVEFFIGIIEVIGEFAKTMSLSLRLFGNVFAGEILLMVMLGLVGYVVPVPFMFLELLVGVIQATVFAMLTLAFLVVATMDHGHGDEHDEEHAHA